MESPQTTTTASAVLAAARAGKVGDVIRLSRRERRLTQPEVANRTNLSQSTISRIERNKYVPAIPTLHTLARVLEIPPVLLGLAEQQGATPSEDPVKRRNFLQAAAYLAEASVIRRKTNDPLAAIHAITTAQRRLDSAMPSRDLATSVVAHMNMTARRLSTATSDGERKNVAAALSEVAGYAAWLHWDMHDIGSARTYYASAIRAAESTGDQTLHAYMLGSLATLAAYEGDAVEGLSLLRSAEAALGDRPLAIAIAWLASLEAVAQSNAGNARRAWAALDRADDAVEMLVEEETPPWPWVFQFDHAKVARHRLTCAARLGRPDVAFSAANASGDFMTSGHVKQRALAQLDLARAYLHAREPERAFELAREAVSIGREVQSGRVIDAARHFRRGYSGSPSSPVVKDFDSHLYGASF